MRRSGFTWVEFAVWLALFGFLAAIVYPVFQRPREGRQGFFRYKCQSNLKQISLGIKLYQLDYDEKFPPVAVARSVYWTGSLHPYAKDWHLFQCPSTAGKRTKTTDYFYNARLSQIAEKQLPFASQTVLFGDGSDDSPTNTALLQLPGRWRDDANSPLYRHLGGANYAFVDGHVKWLKPEQISNQSPKSKDFIATFAAR